MSDDYRKAIEDAAEEAQKRCRYYFRHQHFEHDDAAYRDAVEATCKNLEEIIGQAVRALAALPPAPVGGEDKIAVKASDLLAIRDALVANDVNDAYHILRMMADPDCKLALEKGDHWIDWESFALANDGPRSGGGND